MTQHENIVYFIYINKHVIKSLDFEIKVKFYAARHCQPITLPQTIVLRNMSLKYVKQYIYYLFDIYKNPLISKKTKPAAQESEVELTLNTS